jgi:hypothetical protein
MPRAGWVKPRDDQRLSDHVALGVLTRTFPPGLVDEILAETGRVEQRSRLLPARLVTYYVLGLALFAQASYEEVMRNLIEGLSWESGWAKSWTMPSKSAIFQARTRLGIEPLEALFARGCVPLATLETPGAFYRGWRLVAIDGTTLDVADTEANDEAFGRANVSRGHAAFPQLRLVGLAELGTRAITGAAIGPYTEVASGARDVVSSRPRLRGVSAVLGRSSDRCRSGVAGEEQCGAAGTGNLRRRLVPLRAGGHTRQAHPHQRHAGAGGRVHHHRPRASRHRGALPADHHHPGSRRRTRQRTR